MRRTASFKGKLLCHKCGYPKLGGILYKMAEYYRWCMINARILSVLIHI